MMKKAILCSLVICFFSCSEKTPKGSIKPSYFDLAGYFRAEAKQLSDRDIPIRKTVWINGKAETRTVKINDWEKELGAFIDADINKGSWKGEFERQVQSISSPTLEIDSMISYNSNNGKIPVKKLELSKRDGKIVSVKVFILNKNDLYTSNDTLSYIAGDQYEIRKHQRIKVMGEKYYKVLGQIKVRE